MRLPLQHIYRAFPELDRYTDEQCRRFIAAARRGTLRRLLTGIGITLATFALTALGIFIVSYLHLKIAYRYRAFDLSNPTATWYGILANAAILILMVALGPVGGYLLRDRLLLRRIRRVLRTRGVCVSCRYSLVGLTIGPDLAVICPECGATTTVDPSLGELITDEDGRQRFKPDDHAHKFRAFWTEARLRTLKRIAPWAIAAMILIPLLVAGSYEGFIRWQASVARRERPVADDLLKLIEESRLPGEDSSDPDAWSIANLAVDRMIAIERDYWSSERDRWPSSSRSFYPDFDAVASPRPPRPAPEDETELERRERLADNAYDEQCRLIALEMIQAYRAGGLYDLLREAADTRYFTRTYWSDETMTLAEAVQASLAYQRRIPRICTARMRLALDAGDKAEYLDALRSGLALSALHLRQPIAIEYLAGVAHESHMLGALIPHLVEGLPADWLPQIDALLIDHDRYASGTPWIDGERLIALDTVAHTFSDPSRVRFGRWTPALSSVRTKGLRLGTYAENRNEVLAWHTYMTTMRNLPLQQRAANPFPTSDLMIIDSSLLWMPNSFVLDCRQLLMRRAARTTLAIERYRARHGEPPPSLDALVPDLLPEVPVDPYSDKPIAYKRIDPAADPLNRPYLLYSVGGDFRDDGGATNPTRPNKVQILLPGRADIVGLDFILNSNDW